MKKNKKDPIKHLIKADPILASAISQLSRPVWRVEKNYFLSLVETIINQQLSDKAGATITRRFMLLFPNKNLKPEMVVKIPDEKIRQAGISYQKISYIKDLAKQIIDQKLSLKEIHKFSDEEVITQLIQVRGIGRWTAEMFLMFSLGREDIFSFGDLGLRNAIQRLYKLKKLPTQKQAEKISSKWKPFRTWACRYLWKSLELEIID